MLLPYTSLTYYGPGAGASVAGGLATASAGVKGRARPTATVQGSGTVTNADGTRLVNRPATIAGTGSIPAAAPRARARIASTIKVNTISQDEVTSAVLDAPVGPGLSLRQALLDARKAAKLAAALSA